VKVAVAGALLAVLGVAGLLWIWGREDGPERQTAAAPEGPSPVPAGAGARPGPLPDIERRVRGRPFDPQAQKDLVAFVDACVARGDDAVADLLGRLRDRPDVALTGRWSLDPARAREYPTLRAAYLDALARIPGPRSSAALAEVLAATRSIEETAIVSIALQARGDASWIATALDRVGEGYTPRNREMHEAVVALAAKTDPGETAARMILLAPRGDDAANPRVIAGALEKMPLGDAVVAAGQLVGDAAVTRTAKGAYLESLCSRPEPEVFTNLRDLLARGRWDDDLRLDVAYKASRSVSFALEAAEYDRLRAAGAPEAETIRARYEQRLHELRGLLAEALGPELFDSDDPRAVLFRRTLERHRERLR
jgi:hypothetical protein